VTSSARTDKKRTVGTPAETLLYTCTHESKTGAARKAAARRGPVSVSIQRMLPVRTIPKLGFRSRVRPGRLPRRTLAARFLKSIADFHQLDLQVFEVRMLEGPCAGSETIHG
jgi:hypothetical protein